MSSDAAERFRTVAARSGVDVVLLEPALLEHAEVWAAAGTLSSVFPLSPPVSRASPVRGSST